MTETSEDFYFERCLREANEAIGVSPRNFDGSIRRRNLLKKPWWYRIRFDTRFAELFSNQGRLLENGYCVWGHIVQANTLLFEPGEQDHPAAIVYSFDVEVSSNPEIIQDAASILYEFKGEDANDPEFQFFADTLENEMDSPFKVPIPKTITNGVQCYYGSIMVSRQHLPGHLLGGSLFPVLVHPDVTDVTMILPHWYWPATFKSDYWNSDDSEYEDFESHLSEREQSNIWQRLYALSINIVGIGTALGVIAQIWKGREFTNEDEIGPLLWPLSIIYLMAFLYSFCYTVQTKTSKGLRYFFVYPAGLFLLLLISMAVVFG